MSLATSVRSAGQVIVGFSWSLTVTFCIADAVLPEVSVTVQVTVVVPCGKTAGASLTTLATPQLSAVAGVPRFTFAFAALHLPGSVGTSGRSAGAVIVGGSLSCTVTFCVAVALLPEPSTTVHVTTVVPSGNGLGALL